MGHKGHAIPFSLAESNDKVRGVPVCAVCAWGGGRQLVDEQVYSVRVSSPVLSSEGASLQ